MPDLNLINLENSTPGNKKIISADDLMYNFRVLEAKAGSALYKTLIESTGETYNPLLEDQLAKAVVQYVLGAYLFNVSVASTNYYVLTAKTGYYTPLAYTDGLRVSFYNTVANTADAYIRIDGLEGTTYYEIKYNNASLSAGDLPVNTYVTLTYRVGVDSATGQTIQYFELSESGNTSSVIENLDDMLETLITAAGFRYNQKNKAQLLETIASYVYGTVLQVDTTNTSGSLYLLYTLPRITETQTTTKITPITLSRGQVYSFIPHMDNTSQNVTIMINNSTTLTAPLLNNDGTALKVGQLKQGILSTFYVEPVTNADDVVVSYNFKLCTGTLPFLSLNSKTVNDIVTDSKLQDVTNNQLVTAKAVKDYVNVATAKIEPNSISQSTLDSQGNAALLHQVGDSMLEVLASSDNYKNIEPTTIHFPFGSGTPSVTSDTTAVDSGEPVNVISDGVGDPWVSSLTGYSVDGLDRAVVELIPGSTDSRVIQILTPRNHSTTPANLLMRGINGKPDFIKITHVQGNPIPTKLKLYITLSGYAEYPMCDRVDEHTPNYDYMTLITPEGSSTSTLQVPNYYYDGVNVVSVVDSPVNYSLRISVEEFNDAQVYPSNYLTKIADISTYNPATDTNSQIQRYSWEVESVELLKYDSLMHTAIVTFYDGSTYEFTNNIKLSILDTQSNSASNTQDANFGKLISHTKPGTYYAVLSTAGDGTLMLVDKTNGYFVQDTDPLNKADYYGGKYNTCWVDTSTGVYTMRIASPVEVVIQKDTGSNTWYFEYNGTTYNVPAAEVPYGTVKGDTFNITPVTTSSGGTTVTTPHIYVPNPHPTTQNNGYLEDFDFYMDNISNTTSKFIIIGEVVLAENTNVAAPYSYTYISSVLSYNSGYEHELSATYTATANTFGSVTLNHNFGANVTTRVLLECISDDNGITAGTCYELTPYRVDNINTTTAQGVTAVDFTNEDTTSAAFLTSATTNQNSFFLISSNKVNIILGYKNLGFYNINGTWFTPTSGKWKFVAEVNKRLN